MKLNEQISALRRERKMSQEELAAAMDVSRQAISKWETGQSNPDTENLIRLAEIFQVDVNTLIRENAEETDLSSQHIPKPGAPVAIVWLLSILLVIAIGASILFAYLWTKQEQQNSILESTTTKYTDSNWNDVRLYMGLNRTEIPLTAQEKTELINYITRFHFTTTQESNHITPSEGRIYYVEARHHDVFYQWFFYENSFSEIITFGDGTTNKYYYLTDYILLYKIDEYIH